MTTHERVERNIRALISVRKKYDQKRSFTDRMADLVTRFAGTMTSVYLHVVLLISCVVFDVGLVDLAAIASVEAIFLTTFVLISQNRAAVLADRRSDLDLQVSLLAEHEITRLITMVDAIANRLQIESPGDLEELEQDVHPEVVMEAMEEIEEDGGEVPSRAEPRADVAHP
jgi:uncharacterized membrane protein